MTAQDSQRVGKEGVYFHIYNKGVESRKLFIDEEDYQVFIGYLRDYISAPQDPTKLKQTFSVNGRTFQGIPHQPKNYFNKVEVLAFSLLPDHFHLLVKENYKDSLQKLIRSLSTRYAIYYNKKYKRTGSLFQGPYKSAHVKDLSQLLYLTRYIHREPTVKTFSSYKEYIGERVTTWIKPNIVISYFDNLKKDSLKGINGYKHFIEKKELEQIERETIEGIIIEKKVEPTAKTEQEIKKTVVTPKSPPTPKPAAAPKSRQRTPEFIAASAIVFLLLFTVGAINVQTSAGNKTKAITQQPVSPAPQVAGVENETQEEEIITEIEEIEESAEESITEEIAEEKTMIVIKSTNEFESVNLREEPTTTSEIVGAAQGGDTFELISKDEEWYQIKLDDGSAFVSAGLAEIIEEEIEEEI